MIGTLTNCSYMTTQLKDSKGIRKRKSPTSHQAEGYLDEFIVDETEFDCNSCQQTFSSQDLKDDHECVGTVCNTCGRYFASDAFRDRHICRGSSQRYDLKSNAIRYAYKLIEAGEIDYIDTTKQEQNQNIDKNRDMRDHYTNITNDFEPVSFKKGWAIRPSVGRIYGAKYIDKYKGDIDDMFEQGYIDKRNKMAPGRMLEALRSKYKGVLDIPSESEIRKRITALNVNYNKHGTIRYKRGIQDPFRKIIIDIVTVNEYEITPLQALAQFRKYSLRRN